MQKIVISAKIEEIHLGVEYIEKAFKKRNLSTKDLAKAMLIAEEAMVRLVSHAKANEKIVISTSFRYGVGKIHMSCDGAAFDGNTLNINFEEMSNDAFDGDDAFDEEITRSLLLNAFKDNIEYSHKHDCNYVKITVGDREKVFIKRTLIATILGLIVGIILRGTLNQVSADWVSNNVLIPIQTIYLNSLQMIAAPAIFFSLMVTTARFNTFSDPGKLSRKIIRNYGVTTILAIVMGMVVFTIGAPLISHWEGMIHDYVNVGSANLMTTSFVSLLSNIVPADVISPFQNTDALQLLLLSIVCGLAVGKCGKYADGIKKAAEALNSFFLSVSGIINKLVPIATFFTLLLLLIEFDYTSLLVPVFALLAFLVGVLAMFLVYMAYVVFIGKLNPIIFLKKYLSVFKASVFSDTSTSLVYDNMKFCNKKLGVSKKVSSFSIPFGAVANMDGSCTYLIMAVFLMSFLGGIEMSFANVARIIFMVIVLSLGSPITSGSAMLALTLLMNQMGMSIIAISLLLVSNAFVEIVMSAFNTVGDIAITLAVAKSEGLLDVDVYNKMEKE